MTPTKKQQAETVISRDRAVGYDRIALLTREQFAWWQQRVEAIVRRYGSRDRFLEIAVSAIAFAMDGAMTKEEALRYAADHLLGRRDWRGVAARRAG